MAHIASQATSSEKKRGAKGTEEATLPSRGSSAGIGGKCG